MYHLLPALSTSVGRQDSCSNFTDEETEVQRRQVTCPGARGWASSATELLHSQVPVMLGH